MKQTPEARAEKRYPTEYRTNGFASVTDTHAQERCTYAIAIREEVEPLELKVQEQADELAKLRALVQVIGNAFTIADNGQTETDGTKQASGHAHQFHAVWDIDNRKELAGKPCRKCLAFDAARNALKEAGFTPTTNTEDNG